MNDATNMTTVRTYVFTAPTGSNACDSEVRFHVTAIRGVLAGVRVHTTSRHGHPSAFSLPRDDAREYWTSLRAKGFAFYAD